jgi:ligand-binding SRPBCC domain-containing protein
MEVKNGFDRDLFLSLNPPFPPVKLIEFGGCKEGDQVIIELNFLLFKQQWISVITADGLEDNKWFFIDKGIQLPFFLSYWHHEHIVETYEKGAIIIDDISYETGTLFTDIVMWPVLYLQFLYRKPIYRRIFGKKKGRN